MVFFKPFPLAIAFMLSFFSAPRISLGAVNSWTNAESSSWYSVSNWSAGVLPDSSFDVMLTNAGSKTVSVDPSTPALNRATRALTISASEGLSNTLLLEGLPVDEPFTTFGTFTIGGGGAVHSSNSTIRIGSTFDVNGNLAVDSGLLDSASSFVGIRVARIGGSTGTVHINGGLLNCFGFRLGLANGASGLCTISGGTLLSSSVVSLGETLNSSGRLDILSGRFIATNDITKVGNLSAGVWNQNGGSSEFAFLSIGDNAPGVMNVSAGQVTVTPANESHLTRIGNFGDAQLNITGGDVWLRGEFHIADNPGVNARVHISGGKLASTNALVAIGRYGMGELTVTNATAWLTNTSVGRHADSLGTLKVQDGGTLYCEDDLSIGRFPGATGYAVVSGGLLSLENENLWVGREGTGFLFVSNGVVSAESMFVGMSPDGSNSPLGSFAAVGGQVLLSSNLVVGTDLISTGQVLVTGGRVDVGDSSQPGLIAVRSGTFTLSNGVVRVDSLMLTNAAGQFSLAGGALKVRDMVVSNGAPFVVGDGVNPATLELRGGTVTFADGLVIAPNASVTGCGSIAGPITNNGTMNTNCLTATAIQSITKTGSTATIVFPGLSGATHFLEFKDNLQGADWATILPGVTGTGSTAILQDPTTTNDSRFYRIRSQ